MKKNKNHIIRKIPIFLVIAVLIAIIILIINNKKTNNINLQQEYIAKNYSVSIGTNKTQVDLSKVMAKDNSQVNLPKLSAGMIPIIDIGDGYWQIVDKETWQNNYDYFSNKPAYMMKRIIKNTAHRY